MSFGFEQIAIAVSWLTLALAAAVIGANRGSSFLVWFAAGLFLGPLGVVLAFWEGRSCKSCRKLIPEKARKCPYCQTEAPFEEG